MAHNEDKMKKISLQSLKRFELKWLGVLPLLISLLALIILTRASANPVFHIPYISGQYFNIVLLGGASFFVAYLAWRGFAVSGQVQILLFGGGALSLGMATVLGSVIFLLIGQGNAASAIHNTGTLLSSILFLTGVAVGLGGGALFKSQRHRKWLAFGVNAAVLLLPFLFWALSETGVIPAFFIKGQGGTLLRTVVLNTALSLFAISGLAFLWLNRRTSGSFLHWYGLGILLFALGLYAWQFVKVSDDSFSWLGRLTQYLGGVYFVIAILTAVREARAARVPTVEVIASFFRRRSGHELLESLKGPALGMLVVMLLLTISFASLNITRKIELPYLNLALYIICVIVPSFFMAVITIRTFLRTGSWPVIWLGIGALIFALGNLIGSLLVARSTTNIAVTASNIIYFAGGTFHLMGSFFVVNQVLPHGNPAGRNSTVLQVYLSALAFIAFVTIVSILELLPPFFVQEEGGTALRQMVVGAAAVFFFVSGLVIFTRYLRTKSNLLYWYSMGLLFIFLGMVGIFLLASLGTPLNWVGRIAQYLGGLCLLMATLTTLRESRTRRVPAEEVLAGFFQNPAGSYALVTDSSRDAVITADIEGKTLLWNAAATKMFGYSRDEAINLHVFDLFTEKGAASLKRELKKLERLKQEEVILEPAINEEELAAVRRDRSTFPAILSISARDTPLGWITIVTARDITERKRVEEALIKSEASLVEAQRIARIGSWQWDIKTGEVLWSDEMYTIFGVDKKSFVPNITSFTGFIHADDLPSVTGVMEQLTSEGGSGNIDFRIVLSDGSIRFVHAEGEIVAFDESGKPSLMIGVDQDITERKKAEEALRESEKKYRTLFDSMTEGFGLHEIIFDAEGKPCDFRFLELNAAWEKQTGVPRETVVGKTMKQVWPNLNSYWLETLSKVAITGEPIHYENYNNSLQRWYETFAYSTAQNQFALLFIDITERKRAEEALRKAHDELELRVQERTAELEKANKALLESEASYKGLTESIDDLFYAMDRELRYIYWNKASEALTGILAKDAIGKSLYELFPEVKGTEAERSYIEALKTRQPKRFEYEYQLGDKKLIFEINAYPTKDGLSVIAKDITEKKIFEGHLLRAQRMESIGVLTGGIAHNLNNLLTPIMMSLQTLKQKFKDEQSQKLLTILENNSQRSADLIKQILSFSRGIEGERAPLHVANIVSEIEKIIKETFPRNTEIRTNMPIDIWTISGDATQLHQVIMNLCVNARDAMSDGGILGISAENFSIDENYARIHTDAKVGSYVVISVSDTGIGIPPKIVDRIFEPFFTTKEFGKGTGLGLSTSLAIVKSHGGFINVNSEVGKGTTFRLYLPATSAEMQNVEEQQLELPTGHGELVLIAEDEDSVREVTISSLEANGYKVLAANDGADAVALYAQNADKIKVVLMDMMMPVMDGEASIRAIRKINPDVKVIVVSGLAEKDKLAKIESTRAQAILPKPYTAERLLKAMHEVLSTK